MEHVPGFPPADDKDAIIILIDPDMILLKPMTRFFDNTTDRWRHDRLSKVTHGHSVAQQYLLASIWLEWNLTHLLGSKTPAVQLTREDAWRSSQLGPPYVATARDMWKLAKRWTELCVEVKKIYPYMLAEMYAYILDAADLGMQHAVSHSLMWSDPKVQYTEPWDWVEGTDTEDLCGQMPAQFANVLHYCQPFAFGDWRLFKNDLRGKKQKCSHPPSCVISIPSILSQQFACDKGYRLVLVGVQLYSVSKTRSWCPCVKGKPLPSGDQIRGCLT
jgi:hypothetical protein